MWRMEHWSRNSDDLHLHYHLTCVSWELIYIWRWILWSIHQKWRRDQWTRWNVDLSEHKIRIFSEILMSKWWEQQENWTQHSQLFFSSTVLVSSVSALGSWRRIWSCWSRSPAQWMLKCWLSSWWVLTVWQPSYDWDPVTLINPPGDSSVRRRRWVRFQPSALIICWTGNVVTCDPWHLRSELLINSFTPTLANMISDQEVGIFDENTLAESAHFSD